jgi:phytoene dehydrogenase-like protein
VTEHNRKQVAIAGGGLAGLATATYLARAGHRVTLFEQSSALGGRGATSERAGFLHNMGPHALYPGGSAEQVLAELGVTYTGRKPDLAGVAIRNGRAFTLPVGGRSLVTTRLFGVRARVEAGKQLFALQRGMDGDTRTVAEWLETFSQPASRDYAAALIRVATYGNAPEVMPLADVARQFAGAGKGVTYIDGGWQTLVDGLREQAHLFGAEIRAGERVEAVLQGGRRGLRLASGREVDADAVVLAVPPDAAAKLVPGSTELARHAADAIPQRIACLDVGVTRLPNPRRRFGLGIDTPFYFSVHSAFAKLAPEGRVLMSVAKYIPAGERHDADRDLAEMEAFLELVQPGWRKFEVHRQHLPNMLSHTALPRADHGGIAGRPAPALKTHEGIFVAGDWVGDGGWIGDGTLGSARQAAAAVSAWLSSVAEPALAAAVGY